MFPVYSRITGFECLQRILHLRYRSRQGQGSRSCSTRICRWISGSRRDRHWSSSRSDHCNASSIIRSWRTADCNYADMFTRLVFFAFSRSPFQTKRLKYEAPCAGELREWDQENGRTSSGSGPGHAGSGPEISKIFDGVTVSTSFAQSRLVMVSTSIAFPSLHWSRSRHPRIFSVSMSLGLDIQEFSQSR